MLIKQKVEELNLEEQVQQYDEISFLEKFLKPLKIKLKELLTKEVQKNGTGDNTLSLSVPTGIAKLTKRDLRSVKDEAVDLLEKKRLTDFVDTEHLIEIKDGVNVSKIPPELLKKINKYFDITTRKTTDIKVLKMLVEKGKLNQDEIDKVTESKISFSFTVVGNNSHDDLVDQDITISL